MKKIFISVALFAAVMVSCTTEFETEFSEVENTANVGKFDNESFRQNDIDYDVFVKSVNCIIKMHRQFDYFRAIIPEHFLNKIDTDNYTLDEGVFVIYLWWQNHDTWEVLTEWSVFDDFMANMPDEYFDKYGFYW